MYYKENPFVISIIRVVTLWVFFFGYKKRNATGVSAEESVFHPSHSMCLILSVRKACFSSSHTRPVFMVKAIPSLPPSLLRLTPPNLPYHSSPSSLPPSAFPVSHTPLLFFPLTHPASSSSFHPLRYSPASMSFFSLQSAPSIKQACFMLTVHIKSSRSSIDPAAISHVSPPYIHVWLWQNS